MFKMLPDNHRSFWHFLILILWNIIGSDAISLKVLKKSQLPGNHHPKSEHDHRTEICELPHYGEDPNFTGRLAKFEDKLAEELTKLAPDLLAQSAGILMRGNKNLCHKYLLKYLKEYSEDKVAVDQILLQPEAEGLEKSEVVTSNPILTIKLLRRMVKTLITKAVRECRESNNMIVQETINKMFKEAGLLLPTSLEMEKAFNAFLINTAIYGFNITRHVLFGTFDGKANLTFEDFLDVANTIMPTDEEGIMSYNWLMAAEMALSSAGNNAESESRVELDLAWKEFLRVTGLKALSELHSAFGGKRLNKWDYIIPAREYLCRAEGENVPRGQHPADLKCFFNRDRHPYLYLNPMKVEVISKDPLMLIFYEFLTNKEIKFIRKESPARVLPISAFGKEEGTESDRESDEALQAKLIQVILEKNREPVFVNLVRKVEMLTKLHVVRENASVIDLGVQTPLNQFNNVAQVRKQVVYDFWAEPGFASFIMTLTDFVGSMTIFPFLDVFVEPLIGSAIFYFNKNQKNEIEKKVLSQSCPPILGIKEVGIIQLEKPSNGKVDKIFRKNKIWLK